MKIHHSSYRCSKVWPACAGLPPQNGLSSRESSRSNGPDYLFHQMLRSLANIYGRKEAIVSVLTLHLENMKSEGHERTYSGITVSDGSNENNLSNRLYRPICWGWLGG